MDRKQWEGRIVDGRFLLIRHLGGSAHSDVFLTEYNRQAPQKAVIKLVPTDSGKAEAWMLRRELAARLSHPGLLSIFQFGTCQMDGNTLVYVVMEQSEEDLSQVIPSRPLEPAETRDMLVPVLETLAYLHAEGFVHGSLTPANIMAAGDRVKISSDALLRIGESGDELWAPSASAPPESHLGMTPAGDIWSLGMTVVEVLTQRVPVWDATTTNGPIIPATLEAPFLDIARRCLRPDPRLRCSLPEIVKALQPPAPAPKERPQPVEAVPIAKPSAPKPAPRRRYLLPVGGVVLGGLILTGAILTGTRLLNSPRETPPRPPVTSQPAAVQEKPSPVPPAAASSETAPPSGDKATAAQMPVPAPTATEPARDNSSRGLPAAEVVDRVVPEVPPQILKTIRGRVTVSVRVRVDRSGAVADAELDSHPGSKYFDRVALDAARRWRFKPANDAGQETGGTRLVRFEFRPDGCEATERAR